MRRSWRTSPDQVRDTPNGPVSVVSRQAQIESAADALTMADRAGGTVTILYGRTPTGIPGEALTTDFIVTWQDRSDAKPQYEEPIAFEPDEAVELVEEPQNGVVQSQEA